MFGFDVLTWNTGYQQGSYSKSINKALLGGSPGHAAAELVIPLTPKNRKLIDEINKERKLLVQESTTLISQAIPTPPYYKAVEKPCFKVYFSFWDDTTTAKTPQKHRMVGAIKDQIEKSKEDPFTYSALGKRLFESDPDKLKERKWKGVIGSKYGSRGIETIQHLSGQTREKISLSIEKQKLLQNIQDDKEALLEDVKKISKVLNGLKGESKKQQYLASESVQTILERHDVDTFDALKLQLAVKSAAITMLQEELVHLGLRFGTPPSNIVSFAIGEKPEHGLD